MSLNIAHSKGKHEPHLGPRGSLCLLLNPKVRVSVPCALRTVEFAVFAVQTPMKPETVHRSQHQG